MDLDEIKNRGKDEAASWLMTGRQGVGGFRSDIKVDLDAISRICFRLSQMKTDDACPAVEWLLDNQYLAKQTGLKAWSGLKHAKRLPVLQLQERTLRLQRLGLILSDLEQLSTEHICGFLEGVQEIEPLEEEELLLIPTAIAAGLVHRLRTAAERTDQLIERREYKAIQEEDIKRWVRRIALLRTMDLWKDLEALSAVHRLFQCDPAGVYPKMDAYSRQAYRRKLCDLAKKCRRSEISCAQQVLDLAQAGEDQQHIGIYLFDHPLGAQKKPIHTGWYLSCMLLLTTGLSITIGFLLGRWWAILLFLIPVSELIKSAFDLILLHLVPPRPVFRLDLKHGVPPEGKTLCVIAALLTGKGSGKELVRKLERYALANRRAGDEVCYGILADLPDRKSEMTSEDSVLLSQLIAELDDLNRRMNGQFCLFFREPVYISSEKTYRGRERKRGAILDLVRYLRGRRGEVKLLCGEERRVQGIKFLLVLDSDTILTLDAVNELAGTMLHPMNQPQLNSARRTVKSGYGILQPRVETELSSVSSTTFARLFDGLGGLDPYGGTVSDLYHDLFDQGSFLGKGMIHVDAFLACMDGRFPENKILSHDLLEGSYLRTAWVSRTELMDSFPGHVLSWLDRYHRWIRGDWQLIGWLRRSVRNEAGQWEHNPISPLAKWKIFDNLRRSLAPAATLLALLIGLIGQGPVFLAALLAAVLTLAAQLLTAVVELAWRKGQGSFRRFHAGVYSGLSGGVIRAGAQLLLLPVQSWTALSAICRSLWRMAVSHKHLLDWVTSSQSGQNRRTFRTILIRFLPGLIAGVVTLLFSYDWMGRLLGLGWILSPLLFQRWSTTQTVNAKPTEKDRAFLLHEAALIWRYYEDWLIKPYHFLIPDNVQAMPERGAAERTSPTNIGLALLSCLAAGDLKLCEKEHAIQLIAEQVSTLEQLERWNGHFYNWYEIKSAKPLSPQYVSTVDSGNLCADLIALSYGLEEWGEHSLGMRAMQLANEMDFSLLFDSGQELFYIGYDVQAGQFTPSHYDLMASEARITSYLAIARGEVPPRHWRRLSRAIAKANRYTGLASWSGTMFEYLMPQLLLPSFEDSLWGETLTYCVDQQRRHGMVRHTPWGVSESGFYALDNRQDYQYKAHGIPSLRLQRERGEEHVIAPYATFLALRQGKHHALANLRRLRDLGAEGKYGLYEAVDYSPSRGGSIQHPLIVRSWMAHHLGMSLIAVDNYLTGDRMVERFLSSPEMYACQELLQEKLPVGAPVARPEPELRQPILRGRHHAAWHRSGTGADPSDPIWGIIANEGYSVFLSAGGAGASRSGVWTVLHPDGVQVSLREGSTSTVVFPRQEASDSLGWHYSSGQAALSWNSPSALVVETVAVDRRHKGERRTLTVTAKQDLQATLCILLRPVLDRWDNYSAHPAFSRMCVQTQYIGAGVQFVRRPGRGAQAPVLTILWSDQEAGWTTNRERYLISGSISHIGREGTVLDPCLALELSLDLKSGQRKTLCLSMAVGASEESRLSAQALLAVRKPALSTLLDQNAAVIGSGNVLQSMILLSRLMSNRHLGEDGEILGQASLWPFSISGDLPIVTFPVQESEQDQGVALAGINRCLAAMGYSFDLVLLLPEQGNYLQTIRSGLTRRLEAAGWSGAIGQAGGIHMVSGTQKQWKPILGMASLNLRSGEHLIQNNHFSGKENALFTTTLPDRSFHWHWESACFVVQTEGVLPPLRWSHLLVNEQFGWRCDEAGTGHLWYQNAQMGQITPWQNDPIAADGPECLLYRWDEGTVSLFAANDGIPAKVTFGPGYACWEKNFSGRSVKLAAYVPQAGAARVWTVSLQGASPEDRIQWRLTPKMSHRDSHMPWIRWRLCGETVCMDNPAGTMAGTEVRLRGSEALLSACFQDGSLYLDYPAAAELILAIGVTGAADVASLCMQAICLQQFRTTISAWMNRAACLTVQTPDSSINHYLSFWGPYQVLAGRVWGRSGLYQCGGAVGFRDQLQDVLALLPFAPEVAARQIRLAAGHQFREGDVLHWWHPPEDGKTVRGVRTRISDDLLWLAYALGRWVEEQGTSELLVEQVPYLEGSPLEPGEAERYSGWSVSDSQDCIYQHGVQAIECVLNRGVGSHGLCLIGTGDWNDGMNRLGSRGKGESVWLSWFLALTLRRFAPVCRQMGDFSRAQRYEKLFHQLTTSANRAWDGDWYLRAYDDDGNPLGSMENEACKIDSISQSFAVFAPGPDPELSRKAVLSAYEMLYDQDRRMVRLLWPPFSKESDPGYIRSYPEGLRENAGQYTHAACWLAMSLIDAGETERGYKLLHDLLPENHPQKEYLAEPYVLAGDVYSAPYQEGRGGWSWYTGAAGWYCQAVTRNLLGLRLQGGELVINPKLPSAWPGYSARWSGQQFDLEIRVVRGETAKLELDGKQMDGSIHLATMVGRHKAVLTLANGRGQEKNSGAIRKKDV